jgi:hypothetical protein
VEHGDKKTGQKSNDREEKEFKNELDKGEGKKATKKGHEYTPLQMHLLFLTKAVYSTDVLKVWQKCDKSVAYPRESQTEEQTK